MTDAGAELILVGGRFSGPLAAVPASEIDRDLTASVTRGYSPKEKGIFHFFGRYLREKLKAMDVDLAKLLESDEGQDIELRRREAAYWEAIRAKRPIF